MSRLAVLGALLALASGCAAGRPRPTPAPRAAEPAPAAASPVAAATPVGERAPEPAWRPPLFGPAPHAAQGAGAFPMARPASSDARRRVVAAARALLGKPFAGDCSAYVLRAMRGAGVEVALPPARTGSEALYRAGREVASPRPGDLVFFHDTYDRNRDRRLNDRFTHVALVEEVDGSSLTLLHRGGRGVRRMRMDLSRPRDATANDPVRVRRPGDARRTRYLTGELFAAFGELLDEDVTQMLQASRGGDARPRHPSKR
jgi:hypothetical protein